MIYNIHDNSILSPPVGAGIDKRCVRTVRRVVLVLVQVPGQDVSFIMFSGLWSHLAEKLMLAALV